jgi:uncharacterized protein YjlB
MIASKQKRALLADLIQPPHISTPLIKANGLFPNNPKLPLVFYKGALILPADDPAGAIEELLEANGWGGTWRNGIYDYHHYHSTAHEVLLVYGGSATVQFGGEGRVVQNLDRGDVVILPAGVAHKNAESTGDFAVVGAYPKGQEWDMCYGKPGERPRTDNNIEGVPLPEADPVYGFAGPLVEAWRSGRC